MFIRFIFQKESLAAFTNSPLCENSIYEVSHRTKASRGPFIFAITAADVHAVKAHRIELRTQFAQPMDAHP